MLKFGRNYRLKVRVGKLIRISDAQNTYQWNEEFEIKFPLTVNFTITRAQYSNMNSAHFEIYNLGDKTRAKLYRDLYDTTKVIRLEFYAGYGQDLQKLPLCFAGEVYEGYSFRDGKGTEVKTELTCMTGFMSRNFSFTNRIFEAGTPPLEIIQTLCNDAALQLGNPDSKIISNLPSADRKIKFIGNPIRLLKIYMGGNIYIDCAQDNDKIWILGETDVRPAKNYLVLNANSLLGTPKRHQTSIEINMVFEPRLVESQAIEIKSSTASFFDGIYKIIGFNHTGTISGAVGGTCETKALLYAGDGKSFNFVPENKEKV